MNHMNMYDILNKFRSVADSPATAAAAEQVEKLNGVKRLDEKYMGFEKTAMAKLDLSANELKQVTAYIKSLK